MRYVPNPVYEEWLAERVFTAKATIFVLVRKSDGRMVFAYEGEEPLPDIMCPGGHESKYHICNPTRLRVFPESEA
jgi:hypothetical protein